MHDIYISVDIETNGPLPGENSILSVGAAFIEEGDILGTFYMNVLEIEGGKADPDTMAWWADPQRKKAREALIPDRQTPREMISAFRDWCSTFPGRPVFTAYPAGFDFSFMFWYAQKYLKGAWPFAWAALDIRTFGMAAGNTGYVTKKEWPKRWKADVRHNH